ncbi:MAG: hypothetical protein WD016_12240 [Balneolaceae bacterium]
MPIKILALLIFTGIQNPVKGQFVNIQLKVEPELSATIEQNLEFGNIVTNSGRTNISLGDVNMGIFKIRAFHTQNVYLSLQYPEYLSHSDTRIDDRITLDLSMAYNNMGTNSYSDAMLLNGNNGYISVHERTAETYTNEIWKELYIYVFGIIDVGNITNGMYSGNIILSIDFD